MGGDKEDIVAQNEEDFLATLEELKSTGNYDFIIDRLIRKCEPKQKGWDNSWSCGNWNQGRVIKTKRRRTY